MTLKKRLGRALFAAALDDLDPVAVRVADEAQERAALAHAVRLPFRPDSLLAEPLERVCEIVDADRDMAVAGAELVCAAVVVERQLELLLLARKAEEVVRRLELAVAHDRQLAPELHSESLVEGAAPLRIGDADHRVQVARHAGILREGRLHVGGPLAERRDRERAERELVEEDAPAEQGHDVQLREHRGEARQELRAEQRDESRTLRPHDEQRRERELDEEEQRAGRDVHPEEERAEVRRREQVDDEQRARRPQAVGNRAGECGGRAPEEPCTAQRPRRVRRERVEVLAVEAQTVVVGEPLARHEHARDEAGEEGGLRVDELPSRVHCSKSSRITPYITPSVHSPCRRYALRLTPSLIHPARSACRCARSLKPYTIISSR